MGQIPLQTLPARNRNLSPHLRGPAANSVPFFILSDANLVFVCPSRPALKVEIRLKDPG